MLRACVQRVEKGERSKPECVPTGPLRLEILKVLRAKNAVLLNWRQMLTQLVSSNTGKKKVPE